MYDHVPDGPPKPLTSDYASTEPTLIELGDGEGTSNVSATSIVERGNSIAGRFGLVAALAVVAVAAGFAIDAALTPAAGPETPEAAVAQMWIAIDNEDVLGLIEVLLPSERESLVIPATGVLSELSRLDVLTDDAVSETGEAQVLAGYEFDVPASGELDAPTYEIVPLGGNKKVQWVTTTGGAITGSFDPQKFLDLLGDKSEVLRDQIDSVDIEPDTGDIDFGELYEDGNPFEFAVVEEDGYYYLSIYYTLAGYASEGAVPDFAAAPIPQGGGTPEEAAVQLLDNLVDLDAEGVLATLDPSEFRAAYDYWSEYSSELLGGLDQALDAAEDFGVTWDLVSAEAESSESDGRTVVNYTSAAFSVKSTNQFLQMDVVIAVDEDSLSVTGTLDGEPISIEINAQRIDVSGAFSGEKVELHLDLETLEGEGEFGGNPFDTRRDGDCLEVTYAGDSESICGDDLDGLYGMGLSGLESDMAGTNGEFYGAALVAVERDGLWYVSGVPTISNALVEYFRMFEPGDLDELIEQLEELVTEGQF
jgi:hypothetical protein